MLRSLVGFLDSLVSLLARGGGEKGNDRDGEEALIRPKPGVVRKDGGKGTVASL